MEPNISLLKFIKLFSVSESVFKICNNLKLLQSLK